MHVRELRSLVSFRWRIGKQITLSKNRLHSVIQRFNLHPPQGNLLADKNQPWWDEQQFSELTGFQIQFDLEIITHLETRKAKIDQKLAELSDTDPWAEDMVFLMQIPGFGMLTSMILLAAIGDIARFSHPKKLVGYAGFGAGVYDSGKKHQDKSITKEGRKELRWTLVQAAWGAVRSDPYWKAQYHRLTKVKHPNKAIVAIARRLLVSAWYILTKRETFRYFDDETIAYKMLIWSQRINEIALNGLTRQQFVQGALTAWYFLQKANIQPGQKVLIVGASSGVGGYAVQLSKHYLKADVTGVCSTAKMDYVKSLGTDQVIDYVQEYFTKNGKVYDVVFDTIGKTPVFRTKKSLQDNGWYLVDTFGLPMFIKLMWLKKRSNLNFEYGLLEETTDDLLFIKELVETGVIKPTIDRCFPFEQVADAHWYVESGQKMGNVAITL